MGHRLLLLAGAVLVTGSSLLAPAAGATTSTVPLHVRSSVGSVLGGGTCAAAGSGHTVVATGRLPAAAARPLGLTLTVYGSEGTVLDLAGTPDSATVPVGATRWRVSVGINPGFPPARCVVAVGAAQHLESVYVGATTMVPALKAGDRAVVNLSAYASATPRAGDVVAFHPPPSDTCNGSAGPAVLRVVGLPTQTVEASGGVVTVNGERLAQPWLANRAASRTADFGPVAVPAGDYFVLGDRRTSACDSRTWGPLPGSDLLGKLVRVIQGTPPSAAPKHPKAVTQQTPTTV